MDRRSQHPSRTVSFTPEDRRPLRPPPPDHPPPRAVPCTPRGSGPARRAGLRDGPTNRTRSPRPRPCGGRLDRAGSARVDRPRSVFRGVCHRREPVSARPRRARARRSLRAAAPLLVGAGREDWNLETLTSRTFSAAPARFGAPATRRAAQAPCYAVTGVRRGARPLTRLTVTPGGRAAPRRVPAHAHAHARPHRPTRVHRGTTGPESTWDPDQGLGRRDRWEDLSLRETLVQVF